MFRNVMPPFFGTPGDGRGKRQGTSLLSRAGENTGCIGILGQEVASATFFFRALALDKPAAHWL